MARKKSERYRDRGSGSVLQVRDEGRILGALSIVQAVPLLLRAGTPMRSEPKPEPRFELVVDNSPVITDAINGTDYRYRKYFEERKRERRPRTITQDKGYIRFPDFVIRAEKLLPTVRKAIEGGMREIEYSNLRRLLGM